MSEIKIKCPTCGKILRLQDSPNINSASFTCPVCKEKHVVGKCQRVVPQPRPANMGEETHYGYDEKTKYAGKGEETDISESTFVPQVGSFVDMQGQKYQLAEGENTIGRKATTSPASVQIATADRTMSRSHAIVNVMNMGGNIVHILKNGANKNPSFLNGVLIGPSDQVVLNDGDKVKFGNTELIFKK